MGPKNTASLVSRGNWGVVKFRQSYEHPRGRGAVCACMGTHALVCWRRSLFSRGASPALGGR